jgi:hypothetical protein
LGSRALGREKDKRRCVTRLLSFSQAAVISCDRCAKDTASSKGRRHWSCGMCPCSTSKCPLKVKIFPVFFYLHRGLCPPSESICPLKLKLLSAIISFSMGKKGGRGSEGSHVVSDAHSESRAFRAPGHQGGVANLGTSFPHPLQCRRRCTKANRGWATNSMRAQFSMQHVLTVDASAPSSHPLPNQPTATQSLQASATTVPRASRAARDCYGGPHRRYGPQLTAIHRTYSSAMGQL